MLRPSLRTQLEVTSKAHLNNARAARAHQHRLRALDPVHSGGVLPHAPPPPLTTTVCRRNLRKITNIGQQQSGASPPTPNPPVTNVVARRGPELAVMLRYYEQTRPESPRVLGNAGHPVKTINRICSQRSCNGRSRV